MKFFGKYYMGYLLFAFIVGAMLTIISKEIALLNFMIFTIFVWTVAGSIERLVDDYRYLYREFFVGFDWLELAIVVVMMIIMFMNFLNTMNHNGSSSSLLLLLIIVFGFFIVLSTVRSNLLKSMVHYEWDKKVELIKSTIDKVQRGEDVGIDTRSMVAKILHLRLDWSLRMTAEAVGRSATAVKFYCNRKDKKMVI
jgi:hypothetical protein